MQPSRPPDDAVPLDSLWPPERIGEALRAISRASGLRSGSESAAVPPTDLTTDQLSAWISAAADQEGLEAESVYGSPRDVARAVATGAGAFIRLATTSGPRFLAVLGADSETARVLRPSLGVERRRLTEIQAALRQPLEAPAARDVEPLLRLAGVKGRRLDRARDALMTERLASSRVGGCWLLRPRLAGGLAEAASESGLWKGLALLTGAHVAQSVLFVLSWWLLGRGLLTGTLDRGWLAGWALLLASLIPFRLLISWMQGLVAVAAGASFRRRLLRGGLRIDPQEVREKGAGEFFGLVSEASAVESLALTGGVGSVLAIVELLIAAAVLWAGAGPGAALAITAAGLAAAWLSTRYASRRRVWTRDRLTMTHRLIEAMVGHRTRLVQQPVEDRHRKEDDVLDEYVRAGQDMDRWDLRLAPLVPRAWLVVALAFLAPAAFAGMETGYLAATIGGVLLGFRALRRLTLGIGDVAGAGIAAQVIAPLARAASIRTPAGAPAAVVPGGAQGETVVHARDLVFRYRPDGEPVLQECSLRIPRGSRLLLDGPSGSGKTTLASIVAGLEAPDAGLLLVDGLDRSVLGALGWKARVAMAPQPHDNYLIGASLAFNLLMGRGWPATEADLTEAEQVCRELGLGELLDRMPAGLYQVVGETGWQLSQGERARVFLARALLQHPELLVLDESFSALDPENLDRAVRCVLQRAPTVLAVAHT